MVPTADATFIVNLYNHVCVFSIEEPDYDVLNSPAHGILVDTFLGLALDDRTYVRYSVGMVIETETDVAVLTARLRVVDRALARLTAQRFRLLARIDQLLNPDGDNGRVAASAVAQVSRCSPAQASGELVLARRLAQLPAVSDAFARGEVSTGQIGAVAMIASPGDEHRALELAKTASSATLEREAAARRKDLFEQRQHAQQRRFVSFKPSADQTSITMIARGPWAETSMLQQRLEKIAAQLEKGAGTAKSPFSTRMYDAALMILARATIPTPTGDATVSPRVTSTRLDTRNGSPTRSAGSVAVLERDDAPYPGTETNDRLFFDDPDEPFPHTTNPTVIVTRADTKIVVHYDARTGIVNYQNGPPLDHPRLTALLCDASLEVIHYDNATPNGIITTQRTKTDRQARYLAHRDGPCRVPGCAGIGYTHAHHLTPASTLPDTTETAGLINLCNYNHNEHHDGKLTITGNPEGTITFTWTDGRTAHSTAPTNRTRRHEQTQP